MVFNLIFVMRSKDKFINPIQIGLIKRVIAKNNNAFL